MTDNCKGCKELEAVKKELAQLKKKLEKVSKRQRVVLDTIANVGGVAKSITDNVKKLNDEIGAGDE